MVPCVSSTNDARQPATGRRQAVRLQLQPARLMLQLVQFFLLCTCPHTTTTKPTNRTPSQRGGRPTVKILHSTWIQQRDVFVIAQ